MPDMQDALVRRLIADDAVSNIAGDRLEWVNVPQGTPRPYGRLQTISDPRPITLEGEQEFRETRVQADCFADDYGTARALAYAIIKTMRAGGVPSDIVFGRTTAEGPRDLGEDTPEGFVHRASVDLLVWHSAS